MSKPGVLSEFARLPADGVAEPRPRWRVPERVAMQLTGHKTKAVIKRYNIVSAGDLRDAARRLDAVSASAVAD